MDKQKKVQVLIVEDQYLMIELVQGILEEAGYGIAGIAKDGQQAIDMTAALHPDVVLMDIEIPVIDGLEATKRIQACCPTPVVILTGYDSPDLVKHASAAGAGAYLIKPATVMEIKRAITIATARFSDMIELQRLNSERQRVENSLREANERLHATLNALPDLLLEVDRHGRIYDFRPPRAEPDDIPPQEFLGQHITQVFPKEAAATIMQTIDQAINKGKPTSVFYTMETPVFAGWFELSIAPKGDPQAPEGRLVVLIRDITKRMRVEQTLQESEARYRSTLNAMSDMIHVVDRNLNIKLANTALRQRTQDLGLGDDIIGRSIFQIFPFLSEEIRDEYQQVFEDGQMLVTEENNVIAGEKLITETRKIPVKEGEHVTDVVTVIHDITESKQAEDILRHRLAMEKLAGSISTRFINVTPDKFEEEVNRALHDIGEITGVDHSYIHLLNHNKSVSKRQFTGHRPGIQPLLSTKLTKWAMEKLQSFTPLLVTQVENLPPEAAEEKRHWQAQNIQSVLAIPLVINNQLAGFLGLNSVKTKKKWTEENIRLLRLVGDVFVNALARQKAEIALHQRHLELELFSRLSQALAATLDLDQVLVTLLEEVQRLLGVIACSVWLIDADTDTIVCRQATGSENDSVKGWRLSIGDGIVGWVASHGTSLMVPDVETDERHFKGVDRKTGLPLRSILSVPLRVKQNVIGVIQVVDTEVNRFGTPDLRLLEPLAATAAITIENARLYEQAQQDAKAKAMLLDETNHRVKNNLASILGILALELQQPYKEEADFKATLRDLQSRIQGMTTVHNLLSDAQWSPLPIDKLVTEIIHVALGGSPIRHKIKVHVTSPESAILITPKQATGLAIIINELTTNSIKYAFEKRNEGLIHIDIAVENQGKIQLEFRDDGPGWPEDVLRGERENVGLHLIKMNVKSPLRGQLMLYNDAGAIAAILFKPAPLNQNKL